MRGLLKFVLGAIAAAGAWMWSRGIRDPRQWPARLPGELSALWDDIDDALAAGRRAAVREEEAFDEQMRRLRAERD